MPLVYDRLIAALSEGCDEGLDILIDSLTMSAWRCREVVAVEMDGEVGPTHGGREPRACPQLTYCK